MHGHQNNSCFNIIQISIFALSAAMGIIYVMQRVTDDSDSHVSDNALRAILFIMVGIILLIFNRSKIVAASLLSEHHQVSKWSIFAASFTIVMCASFFGMITCYSYYISGSTNYNMSLGFISIATLLSIFFSGRAEVFDWFGTVLLVLIAVMVMLTGIYLNKASDDLDSEQPINKGMKEFFKDMYIVAIVLSILIIVVSVGVKVYKKFKESDNPADASKQGIPSKPETPNSKTPSNQQTSAKPDTQSNQKEPAYGGKNSSDEW